MNIIMLEFRVDVSTGGGPAEFDIEWMEDGVQIVLYGNKAQYYFCRLKLLRMQIDFHNDLYIFF